MKANTDNDIQLTVVPSGGQQSEVDARDLKNQLGLLIDIFSEVERAARDSDKSQVNYKVTSLSNNSPCCIQLRPDLPLGSDYINFDDFQNPLSKSLKLIGDGSTDLPSIISSKCISLLKDFCKPVGGKISKSIIKFGNATHDISIEFVNNLLKFEAKGYVEKNSHIQGRIEAMNIHATTPYFHIYPFAGAKKVKCNIHKKLIPVASKAFSKDVYLIGDCKYHWRADFPHEIKVSSIEVIPDNPPALDALWGIAPKATGELTTEQFIDNLRHD